MGQCEEMIRALVPDYGQVSSPVSAGGNSLTDATKGWATNIHKDKLVKITSGVGAGQQAIVDANSMDSLIIKGSWPKGIGAGSTYVILGINIATSNGVFAPATNKLLHADETAPQSITLDTEGRPYLEVYGEADAATTFTLDVSDDNVNWINGWRTWAAVLNIPTGVGFHNAFRYIRLNSVAAGVAGNLVSLWLVSTR